MGLTDIALRFLHSTSPDVSHSLAQLALRHPVIPAQRVPEELGTSIGGVYVKSPVGLAAGFDKDGKLYDWFSRAGMGFYVVGSVTLRRRRPYPRPRLYRPKLRGDRARLPRFSLLNALGLPSEGAPKVFKRLSRSRGVAPLMLSIAGFSLNEFKRMLDAALVMPRVVGVELNISCPLFNDPAGVSELIRLARNYSYKKLVLVKLSPNHSAMLEEVTELAEKNGVGLVVYNTYPVKTSLLGAGRGGLSGLPLYKLVLDAITRVRSVSPRVPLVCAGGFFTGRQVLRALMLGCDAVEVMTALVYRGPLVFKKINQELMAELGKAGFSSVDEAKSYLLEKHAREASPARTGGHGPPRPRA